jgi:hypothetical protein
MSTENYEALIAEIRERANAATSEPWTTKRVGEQTWISPDGGKSARKPDETTSRMPPLMTFLINDYASGTEYYEEWPDAATRNRIVEQSESSEEKQQ